MRPADLMTQVWQGQQQPSHQMLMADIQTQTAQLMSFPDKGFRTSDI